MDYLIPNPEFLRKVSVKERKKWHDALLSTDKRQAHGRMRYANQHGEFYCCLMVAHVAFGGGLADHGGRIPGPVSPFTKILKGRACWTPSVGNPEIAASIREGFPVGTQSASECNDVHKLTFEQIAKLVYPNPKLYGRVKIPVEG